MLEQLRSWWGIFKDRLSPGKTRHDFLRELQDTIANPQDSASAIKNLHKKFADFISLLDANNQVLGIMSDMEEKTQGDYFFDSAYIRSSLENLRQGVRGIIESMTALGGADYARLRGRYAGINKEIEDILSENRPVEKDDFIIPFENLTGERAWSVGAKNAGLGEMKTRLGLPVPEGFAVSAWAYKHFIEANDLQERIAALLALLDIKNLDDLEKAGRQIREMIVSSPVPGELTEALRKSAADLARRSPSKSFSLRSSAIGEDTELSFAGQYITILDVRPEEVVERYRQVLCGKFTSKAIYYFLSHSLSEARLAMSVGAVSMVDCAASGVIYTVNPVSPDDGLLLVNAIYGQGKYLVDGILTPDVFRICRQDLSLKESRIARKPVRLVMSADKGMVEEAVDRPQQEQPSISESQAKELAEMALKIENHCGRPRDIEWALDRQGRLFLLQNRPLKIFRRKKSPPVCDVSRFKVIGSGGTTLCPGAGAGAVYFASSPRDLSGVPPNAVLAVSHPFAGIVTVMRKVKAIVSQVGGLASHMATLAREYKVATMVIDLTGLKKGQTVTVDATAGAIYDGLDENLIKQRGQEYESFEEEPIIALAKKILTRVSPLNLLHPSDADFTIEKCRTFHDITRFCHQRAMEEMFSSGRDIGELDEPGLRLKSKIPLPVVIIYLEEGLCASCRGKNSIDEKDLRSEPMKAFWEGVSREGWPKPVPPNIKTFMSVVGTHAIRGKRPDFLEKSYALLGRQYMMLSLRMGYHFTTIESVCSPQISKNYIRMQYKQGGASLDRRLRRIRLIESILAKMGFENSSQGDFLDTVISYQDRQGILEKLFLLGRLNIMTKQLDMALASDDVLEWYIRDFSEKLGLNI